MWTYEIVHNKIYNRKKEREMEIIGQKQRLNKLQFVEFNML